MKNKKKTALHAKILLALIVMFSQVFSVRAETEGTQENNPDVQEVHIEETDSSLLSQEETDELNISDDEAPALEQEEKNSDEIEAEAESKVQPKTLEGSDLNGQVYVEIIGDTESLALAEKIAVEKLAPNSPAYLDAVKNVYPQGLEDKEALAFTIHLLDESGSRVQVEKGKKVTVNVSVADTEFFLKTEVSTLSLSDAQNAVTLAGINNGLWLDANCAGASFQTDNLNSYVLGGQKVLDENQLAIDTQAENLSYKAYYYVLNPSSEQEITPTKGDTKGNWLGVATGQISGSSDVLKERTENNAFNVNAANPIYTDPNQPGITLTTDRGFADIVKTENGRSVRYQYVSSQQEAIDKKLEHFYTITWVRAVVSNGSTTDRNSTSNGVNYFIPSGQGIDAGESGGWTYHVDGVVTLNDSKLVTVVFNVKDRNTGNYVPVSDVQILNENTPEHRVSVPGSYKPGMEVTDGEGRVWVLSDWYRDEELKDGPVDFNNSTNPLKAPRMDYYAEFEEQIHVHYHYKHPDISPDSYIEHESCPHEKIKAGTLENTLMLPNSNNEAIDKGHQITANNGKTYVFSGWHKESPELEPEKLVDFNASTDSLNKHVNYYGVYALQENSLTITKAVTGNMADRNQEFTFEISLNLQGAIYTEDVVGLTNHHDGTYSLILKNGQSQQVILPTNVNYSIKETDDSNRSYDVTYQIIEGAADHGPIKGIDTQNQVLREDTQVIFTNHKQGTVPTGLDSFDQRPVILLVSTAGLFLLLIARRKKRQAESF